MFLLNGYGIGQKYWLIWVSVWVLDRNQNSGFGRTLKVTESTLIPSSNESSNILEDPNITNVMEVLFEIKRQIITKDQLIKVAKYQGVFSFSSCL